MSNQFLKLRRSNIPGKLPTTSSLDFGEIALNTYDGLAFMKKSGSNGEEIVPIGSSSGSFSGSFSGNLIGTASWASNALTASFAPAYLPLTGGTINGNVTVNGTASIAFLNVTIESASVIYSSGSNQFGDNTDDIQTLIGTVIVSGSQQITGSLHAPTITGSLHGTASWANNIEASRIVGNINRIATGSVTASVNTAGNIFTVSSSSVNLMAVSSSGVVTIATSGSSTTMLLRIANPFPIIETTSNTEIILRTNNQDRLKISDNVTTNVPIRLITPSIGTAPTIRSSNLSITSYPYDILLIAGVSGSTRGNVYIQSGSLIAQGGEFRITTGSTDYLRVFPLTGNTFLGSTPLDSGFKLDVNGTTRLQNTLTISAGGASVTGSLNASTITGSLHGTASWAENAQVAVLAPDYLPLTGGTISGSLVVTGSNFTWNGNTVTTHEIGASPHVPYFKTANILATSSIYQSGSTSVIINQDANTTANPEALYVWQPHPTSINVISGKGNVDNYLQLNIQNTNQGADASSDVVATANNGSEVDNYIDMGINSENFAGFLGGPNDSYLYSHGHDMWLGNVNDGYDIKFFNSSSISPIMTITSDQNVNVDTVLNAPNTTGSLYGTASWAENTISSSHAVNADFAGYAATAGTAANGGVTQLIAGSGITLLPSTGVGQVTVISGGGGGGVTILSGSNVTQSFSNSSTWAFTHSLNTRTPIISVFDSNYNQVIPQNIELVDLSSAIITFPTLESGFAVASIGGVSGNAYSSSYALFSTYADTASYYAEKDPVFVARSASLATTGSNVFRGTQTISGSLSISGSTTFNGNVTLLNGATGSLFGTASWAQNALTASFITASNVYGPYGANSVITSSYSTYSDTAGASQNASDIVITVLNQSGAQINKGIVVRITGSDNSSDIPRIGVADWTNDNLSANTLGLALTNIPNGSTGSVMTEGLFKGYDTSTPGWTTGQVLYLGANGSITGSAPTAPLHGVRLGQVIRVQVNNGSIYLRIDNGYEIGELHDIIDNTTTSSFGDLLVKSGSVWINSKQLTGSYAITGSLTVSGSGTFTNIGPSNFTGSVNITGSTTQTGNNTLVGNTILSGSINVSGSQTFNGVSAFYGNHTLSGSNTIAGNTIMSGSILVSGSSRFNNSEFIITGSTSVLGNFNVKGTSVFSDTTFTVTGSQYFTGSSFINGNQSLSGNSTITGSLNVLGNINVISGSSFTRWGNKLFNYGQFINTASIAPTANVSASFTFPVTSFYEGITVVSSSRVTFENTGLYNLEFTAIANQGTGIRNLHIWFKKTGSNIDSSDTLVQLQNNTQTLLAWNFAYPFTAGEYVEMWYHTDGANTTFPFSAAGSGFPAAPSIRLTVTQIA